MGLGGRGSWFVVRGAWCVVRCALCVVRCACGEGGGEEG